MAHLGAVTTVGNITNVIGIDSNGLVGLLLAPYDGSSYRLKVGRVYQTSKGYTSTVFKDKKPILDTKADELLALKYFELPTPHPTGDIADFPDATFEGHAATWKALDFLFFSKQIIEMLLSPYLPEDPIFISNIQLDVLTSYHDYPDNPMYGLKLEGADDGFMPTPAFVVGLPCPPKWID